MKGFGDDVPERGFGGGRPIVPQSIKKEGETAMAYQIKTLNAISSAIYTQLDDKYQVSGDCAKPDAILVRSASMHDMEIPASVLSIARAGAGYNNIPVDVCSESGICVFNTPGANANAVTELAI